MRDLDGGPRAGRILRLRLHSLSGVVPVGLFVLMHFYTNSFMYNVLGFLGREGRL